MSDPYPSRPDDHYRTKTRAWCGCGEWCYLPDGSPCACCAVALAEANPCPHCDGTGIAADDQHARDEAIIRLAALTAGDNPDTWSQADFDSIIEDAP